MKLSKRDKLGIMANFFAILGFLSVYILASNSKFLDNFWPIGHSLPMFIFIFIYIVGSLIIEKISFKLASIGVLFFCLFFIFNFYLS